MPTVDWTLLCGNHRAKNQQRVCLFSFRGVLDSLFACWAHCFSARQSQHSHAFDILSRVLWTTSIPAERVDWHVLYPNQWELAEGGRDRTLSDFAPMFEPSDWRSTHTSPRGLCLRRATQWKTNQSRLAIYDLKGQREITTVLSKRIMIYLTEA